MINDGTGLSCHSCTACTPQDQSPSGVGHRHRNAGLKMGTHNCTRFTEICACLQCRDDNDMRRFLSRTRCSNCRWDRSCKDRTLRHCGCSNSLARTRCKGGRSHFPCMNTSRPPDGSSPPRNPVHDTGMASIQIHPWRFQSSLRCTRGTSSLSCFRCSSSTPRCCDRNCLVG